MTTAEEHIAFRLQHGIDALFESIMTEANLKWPGEINPFDMALALSESCQDYTDWYGIARRHAKTISKTNHTGRPVKVVRL